MSGKHLEPENSGNAGGRGDPVAVSCQRNRRPCANKRKKRKKRRTKRRKKKIIHNSDDGMLRRMGREA